MIYSSGMEHSKFKALARERIPFVGHVGYIPAHNTWFGGPRGVGKSYDEAMRSMKTRWNFKKWAQSRWRWNAFRRAWPPRLRGAWTSLFSRWAAAPDCDGQYLFSCDIWGTHDRHYPRHAKKYRDFYTRIDCRHAGIQRGRYERRLSDRRSTPSRFAMKNSSGGAPDWIATAHSD